MPACSSPFASFNVPWNRGRAAAHRAALRFGRGFAALCSVALGRSAWKLDGLNRVGNLGSSANGSTPVKPSQTQSNLVKPNQTESNQIKVDQAQSSWIKPARAGGEGTNYGSMSKAAPSPQPSPPMGEREPERPANWPRTLQAPSPPWGRRPG
jgi:hypothetical protein